MSVADSTESSTSLLCPACSGGMRATDTICANCRAKIEAEVFAVRAEDYPIPARVARKNERVLAHEPVPSASTIEAQLASAIDNDEMTNADLLPLVPADEPKRAATAPAPDLSPATAHFAAAVSRPAPPTPVVMDTPAKALQSTNTVRNALIAVGAIVVVGILAAVLWSSVVPRGLSTGGAATTQPAK